MIDEIYGAVVVRLLHNIKLSGSTTSVGFANQGPVSPRPSALVNLNSRFRTKIV